ncbi:hypothetical protein ACFQES_00750 [Nonomuraea salmonea]|uniref:hypothetical protein n=1 Tax=Nonomuraea salmonea TaxID=46181 RepID=UPI00360FBBE3
MPAPVEYAPRDFVLHLFSAFCQMTLRHPAPGRRRRLGPGQVAVLLAGLAHTRLAWRAISAARRGGGSRRTGCRIIRCAPWRASLAWR